MPASAASPIGDDWTLLTDAPLPVLEAYAWAVLPGCGGTVLFSGTVRDHAEGRSGVTHLEYEAYAEQVGPKLVAICAEARTLWPDLGRLALLHRIGRIELAQESVIVVASAPHRPEAFEAARFCIDTLKETVPIWKREAWDGGEDWGLQAKDVRPLTTPADAAPFESRI